MSMQSIRQEYSNVLVNYCAACNQCGQGYEVTRRDFLEKAVGGAALLAAWSWNTNPARAEVAEKPKPGGTLRMSHLANILNLEVHRRPNGTNVIDFVYDTLLAWKIGPEVDYLQFDLEPSLAKSWDILDNGKTYVFHLQEGVKWHEQKYGEFTARDVVFSLQRMREQVPDNAEWPWLDSNLFVTLPLSLVDARLAAVGSPPPRADAALSPSHDPSGLDVGFLGRSDRARRH